jgi:spermidine/putrescine transport system substrate-binding protein
MSRCARARMNRRAFLAGAAGIAACSRAPRLNVYNWSDYVGPDTIPDFERETGIRIRYGVYESVQEMLAKVMSGNSGWDVVFPSAEYLQPMRELGLLAELRHEWLPNLDSLDVSFRRPPWDPELRWSVPYMHGTTGIAWQSSLDPPVRSWADLWSPRLAGRMTMLDDAAEVFGACLKMLGYSVNSTNSEELRRAQREALRQRSLVRAYLNAEVRDQLIAGDVLAAQAWAVTASQAISAAPARLSYAFPVEGFARYADNMAILRESTRIEAAHKFLNYLLRPEVSAGIVRATHTATANGAALRLLLEQREDAVLYPSAETLARGEWFLPQPAAAQKLRDRLWTEIKSAQR